MKGDAVAPDHRLGRDHRVDDRLLRRLDRRPVEVVELVIVEHRERKRARGTLAALGMKRSIPGRKGEEDVPRIVFAATAAACDAQRGALRQTAALMRQQRCVRGHDADDRSGAGRGHIEVGNLRLADLTADRNAVDPQALAMAVVGLHQHTDRGAAVLHRHAPRGRADAGLEAERLDARAGPHAPLHHRPARRGCERCEHVFGPNVQAVHVVEVAVPGLGHDRQRPAADLLVRRDVCSDQRIAHHADGVRVGEADRRRQRPRLAHPLEAGHLAVAVERVAAGEDRLATRVTFMGQDHRDAGPDRACADDERTVARDQGGVPDADAGDVGDGIERPSGQLPDDDPQVSRSHGR